MNGAGPPPEGAVEEQTQAPEKILASVPLRRLGAVEEVAETVRFLVCNAGCISGQVIAVDGGRSLTGGM